ncbi:MAG: MerR family DNA-binding transcriptional regulator, partial [Acidobacteria bacterium]|nr:MerR family DNA-binding transcriptional regulator [Acidobacteriota bacterium]
MKETKLKIGEVSKLSGVGIEALRFYEKSGLLDRPARTAGGY